ncbi:hypothetical protein E8E13_002096 [Curvularia kusanoi]|uniref:Uncharacterized protein n=1 Tax=Curvularia kusanoi TaxID=90978 RepID=A0A9P4W3U1_CURKU|nr:hypothetical protein E8E13_002096 [Curvularia kusanoi]
MRRTVLSAIILASPVASQINFGVPGSEGSASYSGSKLCNGTSTQANSTGTVSLSPSIGPNDSISWATTAYQDGNNTELSLWFSPGGKNYSDHFSLGYDVCFLWLKGLSLDAMVRGQSDSGRCLSTLDQTCSTDLAQLTVQKSTDLDQRQSRSASAISNILSDRCAQIASQINQEFPASCKRYFDAPKFTVTGGLPQLGGPLTGPESLLDRARCQLNESYSLLWTQFGDPNNVTWYTANWWLTPLVTAFIPIADLDRPITIGEPKAVLTCLRANVLRAGSLSVPPLDFTPQSSSSTETSTSGSESNVTSSATSKNVTKSLGAGSIAGIVIAAVLILALITGWFTWSARRKRSLAPRAGHTVWKNAEARDNCVQVSELESPLRLKGSVISEMDTPRYCSELATLKDPAELPAQLHARF